MEEVNMAEKLGIDDTKELLDFIFSLAEAVKKSAADGKFSWSDGLNFIEPLKKIGPAIDNIEDVIPEVMDLDASEWNELVDYCQNKFDFITESDDGEEVDIETKIEDALNAGIELLRLTQIIKA
jgi:hypothetical protein|tara:strand:+ start:601 stop:972 length:372 start_codon:yes stop_codon:yes gene_type:complete